MVRIQQKLVSVVSGNSSPARLDCLLPSNAVKKIQNSLGNKFWHICGGAKIYSFRPDEDNKNFSTKLLEESAPKYRNSDKTEDILQNLPMRPCEHIELYIRQETSS